MRKVIFLVAMLGCGADEGPPCATMAEHVNKLLGEDAESRALQKAFEQRCVVDGWSKGMRECLLKTSSTNSSQNCRIYLNDTQQQRWDAELARAAAATARELPEACVAYERLVQRAQACEALSREVRSELAAKLREHQASWATLDDKATLVGSCGAAINAVRNAAPDCFK